MAASRNRSRRSLGAALGRLEGAITAFSAVDSVGRITLDDGRVVKFGATAAQDFVPRVGLRVSVGPLEPHPLGGERTRLVVPLEGPERLAVRAAGDQRARHVASAAAEARIECAFAGATPTTINAWRLVVTRGLRASGLPAAAIDCALEHARVAHALVSGRGRSWLGGSPRVAAWPKPSLVFVAQIATEDVPDLALPGDVAFFYDEAHPSRQDIGCLVLGRADLPERSPPARRFPSHRVRTVPFLTLPAADGQEMDTVLDEDSYGNYISVLDKLDSIAPSGHQLGGHARVINSAMEPAFRPLGPWRLLLQVASDDALEMMWGDRGRLYVWVLETDLAKGRFDRVRIRQQGT